jgi:hypothetical protein
VAQTRSSGGAGAYYRSQPARLALTLPQSGDDAHFDVYASFGRPGTFAVLVTIFYTVPQKIVVGQREAGRQRPLNLVVLSPAYPTVFWMPLRRAPRLGRTK